MRYLVDTHCWLWLLSDPERFSPTSLALLASPQNEVLLSAASAWEIAIKYQLGKLKLPEPPEVYVPSRMQRTSTSALPVLHAHALAVAALPMHHSDPFDRLLIAQARCEGIPLVSADAAFVPYDVQIQRP